MDIKSKTQPLPKGEVGAQATGEGLRFQSLKTLTPALSQWEREAKKKFPRAYPWLWFVGLYLGGLIAISVFAYGLKWLIRSGG